MKRFGIVTAAGESRRMGFDKILTPIADGECALGLSVRAMLRGGCEAVVVTGDASRADYVESRSFGAPVYACPGGDSRRASVYSGLSFIRDKLSPDADALVAIHDAARCFVRPEAVRASFLLAEREGGAVASCPMTDTVYSVASGTPEAADREKLRRVQTPQTFLLTEILRCHEAADPLLTATDDCSLFIHCGGTPAFFDGGSDNVKLTTPEDWEAAKDRLRAVCRVGTGYDTHVLAEGRRLVLCGVEIPFERGLLGHSDADVAIHALIDALLGAAAIGDIGALFPDSDERYRGIDSRILLRETMGRIRAEGYSVVNADLTIIAQRPKLRAYVDGMRSRLAEDLGVPVSRVSVKATTTERMNDEGKEKCISCQAAVMIR